MFLPTQVHPDAPVLLDQRHDLPAEMRDHAHHLAQRAREAPRLLAQALRGLLEQAVQRLSHLVGGWDDAAGEVLTSFSFFGREARF